MRAKPYGCDDENWWCVCVGQQRFRLVRFEHKSDHFCASLCQFWQLLSNQSEICECGRNPHRLHWRHRKIVHVWSRHQWLAWTRINWRWTDPILCVSHTRQGCWGRLRSRPHNRLIPEGWGLCYGFKSQRIAWYGSSFARLRPPYFPWRTLFRQDGQSKGWNLFGGPLCRRIALRVGRRDLWKLLHTP